MYALTHLYILYTSRGRHHKTNKYTAFELLLQGFCRVHNCLAKGLKQDCLPTRKLRHLFYVSKNFPCCLPGAGSRGRSNLSHCGDSGAKQQKKEDTSSTNHTFG